MPQTERMRVWRGELKKTSGGLPRDMLMKNKRGKIVSKRKSDAAKKSDENNLGSWLRSKGDKFSGEPKGLTSEDKEKVVNAPKKEKVVKKIKKEKVVKKVVNAPQKIKKEIKKEIKKVVNAPKKKAPGTPPRPKGKAPMKAGEEKDLSKVSVGNILYSGDRPPWILKYIKKARMYKEYGYTKAKVIKKLGPLPGGRNPVTWDSI